VAVWHFWRRRRAGPLDWAMAAAATLLGVSVAWPHYALWLAPGIAGLAALDRRLVAGGTRFRRPGAILVGLTLMSVDWPAYYHAWRPVFESASLLLNLRNLGLLLVFLGFLNAARDPAPETPGRARTAAA
jgi:hypothetical protein